METKNRQTYNFGDCAIKRSDKIIVCKEKKSEFRVLNDTQANILQVQVDGCLEFAGRQCDCLIIEERINVSHFVELKGNKLNDAIEQLINSIEIVGKTENHFLTKPFAITNAYAVLSRSPKASPEIQKLQKRIKKKYKVNFKVANSPVTVKM